MPDPLAEWTALLDRFERDLDDPATETPWAAATAPLPAELADRARELAERQRAALERIERELTQVREHLTAVRRVPPVRGDVSVYLDVAG